MQAVETAIAGNGWVKLVSDKEAANYQVAINTAGEYEICAPSETPIANLRPPLKVSDRNAAINAGPTPLVNKSLDMSIKPKFIALMPAY